MIKNNITTAAAEQIRALHAGGRRVQELAREHGVSPTTISRIVKMQLHVPATVCVVPLVLTRRVHALAALRAAEASATLQALLCELVERALDRSGGEP